MGYAPQLHRMIASNVIGLHDEEQSFFTKVFLDEKLRKELEIKLDSTAEIFQNLDADATDIQIRYEGKL